MKKCKMGLVNVMVKCYKYQNMEFNQRAMTQDDRLRSMVQYVRENSSYFKELYKDVKQHYELKDLPPTNKVDLMEHFDEWICDQSVKLEEINDFMTDLDNIGRKFKNKYLVLTTSGSTGNPAVVLYDSTTNNCMGGINVMRAYARKKDMVALIKGAGKTIGVFATEGFYLGNSTVRARLLSMPWKKKQMAVTSALQPIDEIVKELNQFQPCMLGGYPTILELLIEEQISGRLHINPSIIMTGGEHLSEELRARLSETFHCYVQTSYSCTEGGSIACECSAHHFHINDDWVIVEAVDKENRPMADGVLSDKILITNLSNYTQPFIRYEINDRVMMHHEACTCGNPSPWLTIEGRDDDIATFMEGEKSIKISPLAIYATLKEIHEVTRFQILVYNNNRIEVRLIPKNAEELERAFTLVELKLKDYLEMQGICHVSFIRSKILPSQHSKSGKFKHVINHSKQEYGE